MKLLIAFIIGCLSATAFAQAASYTLVPVSTVPEAAECAKKGGRGATVYTLMPDGYQAEYDGAYCILLNK